MDLNNGVLEVKSNRDVSMKLRHPYTRRSFLYSFGYDSMVVVYDSMVDSMVDYFT